MWWKILAIQLDKSTDVSSISAYVFFRFCSSKEMYDKQHFFMCHQLKALLEKTTS